MRRRETWANLPDTAQRFLERGWQLFSGVWGRVREDSLLTAIVSVLLGALVLAAGGLVISSMGSLISDKPSPVEEIAEREIWTADPILFPESEGMLDRSHSPSRQSRFDVHPPVRTAQELAEDAFDLRGVPVIVVGRVGAIESRDVENAELGGQEIALLGRDGRSRVVLIAGWSVRLFPPPLVPERPGKLVPLPGSLQRFKPDFKYGIFMVMVAAVGTTTSPDGGPVHTAYVFASSGLLMSSKDAARKFGPAVQQALNDLPD